MVEEFSVVLRVIPPVPKLLYLTVQLLRALLTSSSIPSLGVLGASDLSGEKSHQNDGAGEGLRDRGTDSSSSGKSAQAIFRFLSCAG